MLDIQARSMTSAIPTPESEAKVLELALSQLPIATKAVKAASSNYLFSAGNRDPLSLIDTILSKYISEQTKSAEAKADNISLKSEAIAEINRLWGLIMSDRLPSTKPGDDKSTKLNAGSAAGFLSQIDDIIKTKLGNPQGVGEIAGTDWSTKNVTYDQLQSMNATMTAYCDTIQVDLDTEQQKFKNTMTEITSAQEEIRDVRRAIISVSQGG
ncbi:hypothetical protein G3495_16870 [Shewanella baltica]|uniref:hypothetical protein n=1 Tax=Shewanella baltica TaxID=62322 RepID=UPI0001E0BFAE|nr:hypothetical protein [Shewanella baltica]AEG13340.1 hypothetical protein Sbal175_4120 [Shewanella baltica BA175]EHQ13115.1 hypothetical protein Sbal183_0173 [Shewanella baltica OS183]MCS6236772.1 hypothetical protein [Shewanella baltica]MCS6260598.1 hypothetical protein [Shewanella baltica]MCS6271267.1 hypothetical protein [Shewanella baltica]